ncbi:hypothetical protein CLF_104371 [Clonorchis sinensis]|uniref:Uncharacterized protein n=1 Tax=Clonorchis sinensis TaxID=79923 RepID=G7YBI7_CLOSI|nr:hypothetical protein CLF_104371 [Clonorchis sinensis]
MDSCALQDIDKKDVTEDDQEEDDDDEPHSASYLSVPYTEDRHSLGDEDEVAKPRNSVAAACQSCMDRVWTYMRALAQSRLAQQAQSDHRTGSGVRFNGKNVHSTPCATHKSVTRTQRAHYGEQTQVTDCDFRKSQSNNSFGGLRKADPSIRDDHRLVDQKVDITTSCTHSAPIRDYADVYYSCSALPNGDQPKKHVIKVRPPNCWTYWSYSHIDQLPSCCIRDEQVFFPFMDCPRLTLTNNRLKRGSTVSSESVFIQSVKRFSDIMTRPYWLLLIKTTKSDELGISARHKTLLTGSNDYIEANADYRAKFHFEDRFLGDTVGHYTSTCQKQLKVSFGGHCRINVADGSLRGFAKTYCRLLVMNES